jgi:hypothetical protein
LTKLDTINDGAIMKVRKRQSPEVTDAGWGQGPGLSRRALLEAAGATVTALSPTSAGSSHFSRWMAYATSESIYGSFWAPAN